jgi:hypothetical protein
MFGIGEWDACYACPKPSRIYAKNQVMLFMVVVIFFIKS